MKMWVWKEPINPSWPQRPERAIVARRTVLPGILVLKPQASGWCGGRPFPFSRSGASAPLERRDTSSERNRINGIFKGRGRRRIPGAIAPDRLNGKGLPPHHPDACGQAPAASSLPVLPRSCPVSPGPFPAFPRRVPLLPVLSGTCPFCSRRAHKSELAAEAGTRKLTRYAKRRWQEHPARKVAKWERKDIKARAASSSCLMRSEGRLFRLSS